MEFLVCEFFKCCRPPVSPLPIPRESVYVQEGPVRRRTLVFLLPVSIECFRCELLCDGVSVV